MRRWRMDSRPIDRSRPSSMQDTLAHQGEGETRWGRVHRSRHRAWLMPSPSEDSGERKVTDSREKIEAAVEDTVKEGVYGTSRMTM